MPTLFKIQGPFPVPFYIGKGGRTIRGENIGEFWAAHHSIEDNYGCYVFAIRAGRGYTPVYVGQAKVSFRQEIFAPHKVVKYQEALAECAKGTPVVFVICSPLKKGPRNVSHIEDLEDYLIQTAVSVNPNLKNIQGTTQEEWGIVGVLRGGSGKKGKAAAEFTRCMKI